MGSETPAAPPRKPLIDRILGEDRRVNTVYRWVEILSAVVLSAGHGRHGLERVSVGAVGR